MFKIAEQKATAKIAVLYDKTSVFGPSKEFVKNSNVMKRMKEKEFKTERATSVTFCKLYSILGRDGQNLCRLV